MEECCPMYFSTVEKSEYNKKFMTSSENVLGDPHLKHCRERVVNSQEMRIQ